MCDKGLHAYKKFKEIIYLDEVIRQKWEKIEETDSDSLKKEKTDQKHFVEFLERCHEYNYDKNDYELLKSRFKSNYTNQEVNDFLLSKNAMCLVRTNKMKNLINFEAVKDLNSKKYNIYAN